MVGSQEALDRFERQTAWPDAIPGVLRGCAGEAGQRERGKPSADVRLDGDRVSSHPDDGDPSHATRPYIETAPKSLSSRSATRGPLRQTGATPPTRRGLDSP
jgi:hypothetical protein